MKVILITLLSILAGCGAINGTQVDGGCEPYKQRCKDNTVELCDGSEWLEFLKCPDDYKCTEEKTKDGNWEFSCKRSLQK